MAIGDIPNQNLFGTNYNAEEEERKKAELAAQGAMMGATGGTQDPLLRSFEDSLLRGQSQNNPFGQAGIQAGQQFANNIQESRNLPASAFGQAPAVAPFSMEAAGQVNPMMQPQSLESFAQPQVITEPPVAAVPNVASSNDPSFMSKLGAFFNPSGASGGGAGLPPTFTPPSAGVTQAQEGTDITPVTLESLGLESSGQRILKEGLTQAPSGTSALVALPSVTPPVETPSEGLQEQGMDMNQSAIMNALTDQNQGMDMNQQAIANAQGQEATVPPPAQTLSQFMRYEDAPEQRTEQFVDEQGRLRFRPTQEALQLQAQGAVVQPPVDALSSFEQASLERQQRIGGTGSFEGDSQAMQARLKEMDRRPGESQADRDTRVAQSKTTGGQTGGMSFDDARRRGEGQLAERGVKNPAACQVNALARAIHPG